MSAVLLVDFEASSLSLAASYPIEAGKLRLAASKSTRRTAFMAALLR